jgi:hypothetical protein
MNDLQPSLFQPYFDGESFVAEVDGKRLGDQMLNVYRVMADGQWHSLAAIEYVTGYPQASISARIRDLRKPRFGGRTIERQRVGGGLFRYRMVLR